LSRYLMQRLRAPPRLTQRRTPIRETDASKLTIPVLSMAGKMDNGAMMTD